MFRHLTVLKEETIEGLNVRPDGIYVDCTMGGAGHSEAIASRLEESGLLVALDQDEAALEAGAKRLAPYGSKVRIVRGNFRQLKEHLITASVPVIDGWPRVDGIVFDLGVSSPQLDEAERGFSYNQDAELDMRMDRNNPLSAKQVVNEWPEQTIATILKEYGEERYAARIARSIVERRKDKPIETTLELAELIRNAIPAAARREGPHPAKRSFQAIRIAVNDELRAFEEALERAIACLKPGGRLCVITFHSLEDRICKRAVTERMKTCVCPPDFPVCVCGRKATMRWVHKKPIVPSAEELRQNPRARSAKLRIAEKIGGG